MKNIIAAMALGLSLGVSGIAFAEPVKVGMITTLSGGGAGLGVDARDGFMLALKMAGDAAKDITVVTEDDAMKPELAVQNDNFHEAAGNYAQTEGIKKMFILAPNYPAGTDSLNGFKRFYKGELAGEVYTKLGQTDYAAEIAQIRASGADSVFFFLPGGMGIAFMKQYAQSGVNIPVMGPGFSFSQDVLGAIGDAAIGAKNTASWSPDLDNAKSKAFVEEFRKEYNRIPSIYAAQAFDTGSLIVAAAGKASVKDADAFREALAAADFESVRGKFSFNTNHHPIQDFYVREVYKDGDGVLTNKIVGTSFTDHKDAYAAECKM